MSEFATDAVVFPEMNHEQIAQMVNDVMDSSHPGYGLLELDEYGSEPIQFTDSEGKTLFLYAVNKKGGYEGAGEDVELTACVSRAPIHWEEWLKLPEWFAEYGVVMFTISGYYSSYDGVDFYGQNIRTGVPEVVPSVKLP